MFITVISVSTAGYIVIEPSNYTFLDALFITINTVTTLGSQAGTLSDAGKIWTIFVVLAGLVTGGVLLSLLGAMMVEGQLRRILGRRQLEDQIKNLSDHVIVCGCGRMGERVATQLQTGGRDIVIVDIDPERTSIGEAIGMLYVLGDAQNEEVLEAAGIAKASTLVSTLATDAENLLVTLTARQMNPDVRIITRALDGATQKKLIRAGATRVVCPQVIGASRMVDIVVRPAVVDFSEAALEGVDLEMDQIELGGKSELVGKSLQDLNLPQRVGAHVVAIRRAHDETIYQPGPEVVLEQGDTLILIGKRDSAEAMAALQSLDS